MSNTDYKENNFVKYIDSYYKLSVKSNINNEELWIKKLRSILNTDIHESSLGCRINDTHVKIGNIHMSSFFEARFMFSQQKWIIRFANWLKERVDLENSNGLLMIGYETYLEPVLSYLKLKFPHKVEYCIYEVQKHLTADPNSKTDTRIRYIENVVNLLKKKKFKINNIIFLCGISSTLSTYGKMQNKFLDDIKKLYNQKTKPNYKFTNFALIQVLPKTQKKEFVFSEDKTRIEWKQSDKVVTRFENNKEIKVDYLVDVFSEWQLAEECKWCFCKNERPLITVDDTSVVPQQIITVYMNYNSYIDSDNKEEENRNSQIEKINFFDHKKIFSDCIYYKHIERGENHYQYYIRTAKMFWEIIHNDVLNKKFQNFCDNIKKKLCHKNKIDTEDKHVINIIITPIHYSNVLFPSYINYYVFDGKAHIITVEPKKEFRSNFVTKYSNYAYLNEQFKNKNVEIRFHYIDDQIVSGGTFYRTKSLVRSLKNEFKQSKTNSSLVFYSIIILLNRISSETQKNYIQSDRFFSLIDVKISHIRNHGDACPLCKQTFELREVAEKSSLIATKKYWNDKADYHEIQSLKDIKKQMENLKDTQKNLMNERHFMRLECEDILTECSDIYASDYTCLQKYLYETIRRKLIAHKETVKRYELLISFIKALSRPFLYYRENVKKFAFKFLLEVLDALIYSEYTDNKILIKKENYYGLYNISLSTSNCFLEQYCLLCVILNQLSAIGSNYLLNFANIIKIMLFVNDIKPKIGNEALPNDESDISNFGEFEYKKHTGQSYKLFGIGSIIANNYKRVICGLSGEHKIKKVDKVLGEKLFEIKSKIENLQQFDELFKLYSECNFCLYKYKFQYTGKIIDINTNKELGQKLDDILHKISKYGISKNINEKNISKHKNFSKLYYLKILFNFICLLVLKSYNILNNFIDIIEIIYFENCHTDSQDNNDNDTIKKLLNLITENELIDLKLCLNSDVDDDSYYILENDLKSSNSNFLISNSKLVGLFSGEDIKDSSKILYSIDSKGFFYNDDKDKWLILLCKDVTSDEQRKGINSYLFVEFPKSEIKSDKDKFLKLKDIIKKYRCRLTECIDKGIRNGSLYAIIKKDIAKKILSSEKTQSHGKSEDLVNLYDFAKSAMNNTNNESAQNDKIRTYTLINLLMNRLISSGALKNNYETYFGVSNTYDPLCNSMQKVETQCYEKVKEYLDYITSDNCEYIEYIHKLHSMQSGKSIGKSKIVCIRNNNDIANVSYVPQLLAKFRKLCSEDSAIWLIGILDVFIRNAIKHSPKTEENIIEITAEEQPTEEIELSNRKKYKYCYAFIIKNKIDDKDFDSGEIHLTNQYFMKYLPSIKTDDNYVCVEKKIEHGEYILKISFNYKSD